MAVPDTEILFNAPKDFTMSTSKLKSACKAIVLATAVAAAYTSAHAGVVSFTSGTTFYKRVVSNDTPLTTTSTSFVGLPSANTTIFVPPGATVLVGSTFDAESRCSGGGQQSAWCELRIMIDGVEGHPQSSTSTGTLAFDSTDAGTESANSWEAHAMSRHLCVRNTTSQPKAVRVEVQWKISNFFAGSDPAPEFWIDDSTLAVTMSTGCTQQNTTDTAAGAFGAAALTPVLRQGN